MKRVVRADPMKVIDRAHFDLRTLASRLDLPGWLRMQLHRIADRLLGVLLAAKQGE